LLMLDSLIEKLPNTSMITNISYLNTSVSNSPTKPITKTVGTVGSNKLLFALEPVVIEPTNSKILTVLNQLILLMLLIHYL
jgi:hypothetical protein